MKKVVCFGDASTEMGVVVEIRGFVARLAERYVRRADVLARGFSGYTTRDALAALDRLVLDEQPASVILSFGANDSVLPEQFHHVPLDEYRSNMETLCTRIACSGAWLILVTPPPNDEARTRSRAMAHTAPYALACYETGLEMNVPVIDLFHLIQQQEHWEQKCLSDGIHLSAFGMDILYEAIVHELDQQMPLREYPLIGLEHV